MSLDFNPSTFKQAERRITGESIVARLKETLPHPNTAVQGMKAKGGGEVGGPCPKCSTSDKDDRFFIRADGSFMCRKCGAKGGDVIDFFCFLHDTDIHGLAERYLAPAPAPAKQEEAAAIPENLKTEYIYTDETGAELSRVRRYEASGKRKTFRQGYYSGEQWVPNLKGVRRVLYHLPEVMSAEQVILVEGEKDADNVRALGLVATTAPCGAGKWEQDFTDSLANKDIVALPDNDAPGKKHAETVSRELLKAGCSVRIVNLPGLPEKGDVSDWVAAGGTKEKLVRLIGETEPIPAESKPSPYSNATLSTDLSKLDIKIEYDVDGLIPENMITLFVAPAGTGKTTASHQMSAGISNGSEVFGLTSKTKPVFYIDYENPDSTIVACLRKISGNASYYIWRSNSDPPPPKLDDLERRDELFNLEPGTVLIIDTLKASNDAEENSAKEMNPIFDFLKRLRNHGLTIILLHHTNKGPEGVYRGSSVIVDQSDHVIYLSKVKAPGSDVEASDDMDEATTYRLGVKGKTRAKPFRVFLEFDKETEIFKVADDPDTPHIEEIARAIAEITASNAEANQSAIIQTLTNKSCGEKMMPATKIRSLLKKRDGIEWVSRKGTKNATIYSLSSLPGQFVSFPPINRGEKLKNRNRPFEQELETESENSLQSPMNSEFASFSQGNEKHKKQKLPSWAH